MAQVIDFGAVGDGVADDTSAVQHAVDEGDGRLEFPRGIYRIVAPIEIDLTQTGPVSVTGDEGTARIVMAGPGPALRIRGTHQGTADPEQIDPAVWQQQRFPTVTGLEIIGEHAEADGIELLYTMQPTIERVAIRNCRFGIHLSERNRNVLISACHIYGSPSVGIFIDRCNLHQMIVSACHISYCRNAGIKSTGGDLHNLQITGNDIEYNYGAELADCADVWFDASEGVASEITIASNTIQARVSERGTNVRVSGTDSPQGLTARLITLSGNVLGSQSCGIEMHHVDRAAITGNTLYDGKQRGVHLTHCRNIVLGPNTYGWAYGHQREMSDSVLIENSSSVSVNSMIFQHSRALGHGIVELRASQDCSVSDCQIIDSDGSGVRLDSCRRCRVTNNTIVDSRTPAGGQNAIEIVGESTDNLVANNLVDRPISERVSQARANTVIAGNHQVGDG